MLPRRITWSPKRARTEALRGATGVGKLRGVNCARCQGPLIYKSRGRLVGTGLVLIAVLALIPLAHWLWAPAGLCAVTGVYLVAWGTVGNGTWCRSCKAPRF
jgi:hypothetical protein